MEAGDGPIGEPPREKEANCIPAGPKPVNKKDLQNCAKIAR
jgi:hypothetical protein